MTDMAARVTPNIQIPISSRGVYEETERDNVMCLLEVSLFEPAYPQAVGKPYPCG